MSKAGGVPDAWDDDWENAADKSKTATATATAESQQPIRISRAERKAQHQEANKQLWQAAEAPEQFHFLETKGAPPLKAEFKPAVKVLSRKPQIAKSSNDPSSKMAGLIIDDGDDSEEEDRKRREADFVERQKRAQIEREEKQRKYAEVRERLFGSSASGTTSRESSSASQNRSNMNTTDSRNSSRKGRARGGKESQPTSAAHSPARHLMQRPKELFDPGYDARPKAHSPRPAAPREEQPVRAPRGPDNSGRGGFGFAPRGGGTHA